MKKHQKTYKITTKTYIKNNVKNSTSKKERKNNENIRLSIPKNQSTKRIIEVWLTKFQKKNKEKRKINLAPIKQPKKRDQKTQNISQYQ